MGNWREIRQEVLTRDNQQCLVCGKEHSGQVHHIIPRSQGGTNELSNLIVLCGRCHMVISPVPPWLTTKLWQIPEVEIPKVADAVEHRIAEVMKNKY